jgi:hypothetical protein
MVTAVAPDRRTIAALEAESNALPTLGQSVFWTLRERQMPAGAVHAAFERQGLSAHVPSEVRAKTALRRALRQQGGDLIKKTRDDALDAAYALVDVPIDGTTGAAQPRTRFEAAINKQTEAVVCSDPAEEARLQQTTAAFRGVFLASDLSRALRGLVRVAQGTPLRPSGGVYFVPRQHRGLVARMREIVAELQPDGGYVSAFGVVDTAQARADMGRHAHEGLLEELQALADDLAALKDAGEAVRARTLQRRLTLYEELRAKASMYADLLTYNLDDVHAGIDKLAATVGDLLGVRSASTVARAATVPLESGDGLAQGGLFDDDLLL